MTVTVSTPPPSVRSEAHRPLWRHAAFVWPLAVAALIAVGSPAWWRPVAEILTGVELSLARLLPAEALAGTAWFLLPLAGFGGGLLASLSPCILPLVPLNVAAIGAAEASGWRAASLSGRFVLGAALALAVLGLFGDLAGVLLVEQRGPVLILAGLAMLYFGLAALELVPIPFAGRAPGAGRVLGPVAAGAGFSLVTTPCASPLAAAVLTASSAQALPGLGVASMLGFALGYTALVFIAGVFGGGLVARARERSYAAPRAAAAALLLVAGAGFSATGIAWF